jgi:lipopolysaccharide export system protein LptC
MYVSIEQATRTDNDHLQMKNANMQTFDEKETPDATIFMTSSVLDLNTRIVTSEVPSIVSRSDFQIVGQKMVFDTQKHKGRMTGHVRMTVYNREATSASSPSPSPGSTPGSTPTPP